MKEAPKLQTHAQTFLVTSCGENEVLQAKTDKKSVMFYIFYTCKMKLCGFNEINMCYFIFIRFSVSAIVKLFCISVHPGRGFPPLWLLLRFVLSSRFLLSPLRRCDCDLGIIGIKLI